MHRNSNIKYTRMFFCKSPVDMSVRSIYWYTLPLLWWVEETLLCIVCQYNTWKLQGPQVKMLQTFLVRSAEMQVADGGKFRYFQ